MLTILEYENVESTNDTAKQLIQQKKITHNTAIITQKQSKGKGQRGNEWHSQSNKNITCSIVCDIHFLAPSQLFSLINCVAVTCHQYLHSRLQNTQELKIKWVNDLYYQQQKIGGILIENSFVQQQLSWSVIGIGININQIHFHESITTKATSLLKIQNQAEEYHLQEEYNLLFSFFEKNFQQLQHQAQHLLTYYNQHLFQRNRLQHFKCNNEIIAAEILYCEANGKLVLDMQGEKRQFEFGEIEWVL